MWQERISCDVRGECAAKDVPGAALDVLGMLDGTASSVHMQHCLPDGIGALEKLEASVDTSGSGEPRAFSDVASTNVRSQLVMGLLCQTAIGKGLSLQAIRSWV